jgi:cytochrome c-type biogenesis protein CcmH
MMLFWLVCGVCVLIALAFVLPPLWQKGQSAVPDGSETTDGNITIYRDQLQELDADLRNGIISPQQYEQDRDEINRRILEDAPAKTKKEKSKPLTATRGPAYAIALALPLLAVGLYLKVGNHNARQAEQPVAESAAPSGNTASNAGGMSQAQIEQNVSSLAKRLESNPGDLQGWKMLARSYSTMERYDEAAKAYEKALALQPRDVDLITNLAFALAMANGRNFEGRPADLIDQALKIEPDNTNALGLAGGIAFEQKNYPKAIEYWNKALKKVPPDSDLAQAVNQKINEAKALASGEKEK